MLRGIVGGTLTATTAFQLIRNRFQDEHSLVHSSLKRMRETLEGTVAESPTKTNIVRRSDNLWATPDHWNSTIRAIARYLGNS
jgi:hypothetical protein